MIHTGDRMRLLDRATVAAIADSIEAVGQLQPIGVRKAIGGFRLIFGLHHLEAMRLCQQRGLHGAESVLATIYPQEMPDDECLAAEVIENLMRKNLRPEEAAHRTWLVAFRSKEIEREKVKDAKGENSVPASQKVNATNQQEGAAAHVAKRLLLTKRGLNKSVAKAVTSTGRTKAEFDAAKPEQQMEIAQEAMDRAKAAEPKAKRPRPQKTAAASATPPSHEPEVAERLLCQAEAARMLDIPEWHVAAADLIKEQDEELFERVKCGKIGLFDAAKIIEQRGSHPDGSVTEPINEPVTPGVADEGEAGGLSRLEAAWEAATDEERAEFTIGRKMEIRCHFVASTRATCSAILSHADFKGDPFVYRHMQQMPDLPTEAQDNMLQQAARKLGITH